MDRTLILVKPDAFERGLTGEIIARFERKGLGSWPLKHMTVERELAEQHYDEHREKPFFGELVEFITGGPLVALRVRGLRGRGRGAPGDRGNQPARVGRPARSAATSRLEVQTNLVHGSDSPESAAREIALFFPEL